MSDAICIECGKLKLNHRVVNGELTCYPDTFPGQLTIFRDPEFIMFTRRAEPASGRAGGAWDVHPAILGIIPDSQPERPEPAGLPDEDCDEHDCSKCGKSVYVPDGYEFDGRSGDMCCSCLKAELEALKQSHAALVDAANSFLEDYHHEDGMGSLKHYAYRFEDALATARKLTEATR